MTLFGEAAMRLSTVASQLLGWRPDEFWGATPAELATALLPSADVYGPFDTGRLDELRRQFPDD